MILVRSAFLSSTILTERVPSLPNKVNKLLYIEYIKDYDDVLLDRTSVSLFSAISSYITTVFASASTSLRLIFS